MEKLKCFVEGYVYALVATVVFAAFGWITVAPDNRLFVFPAVALATWTMVYCAGTIIWFCCLFLAAVTMGFGILIGFGVSAFYLLKVVAYLFPPTLVTFTDDNWGLVVMGAFYCIAYVIFADSSKQKDLNEIANS